MGILCSIRVDIMMVSSNSILTVQLGRVMEAVGRYTRELYAHDRPGNGSWSSELIHFRAGYPVMLATPAVAKAAAQWRHG